MRKSYLKISILVFFLSIISCENSGDQSKAQDDELFTMHAQIDGIEDEYLLYYEKDDDFNDGLRIDTLEVVDNKFTFTDSIENYRIYFINVPQATRLYTVTMGGQKYNFSSKANVNRLWFIGYPGAVIKYKGKMSDYIVDAYPKDQKGINDKLGELHKRIFPSIDRVNAIGVDLDTIVLDETEKEKLIIERQNLLEKINIIKTNFILDNPKSIAASYIFSDMFLRKEFEQGVAKKIFKNLDSTSLRGTTFYEDARLRLLAIENTKIGDKAPELLTYNTLNGEEFKLSDLKGNYVLLDYWGLWCGPCMAEMPKIKELNIKYSDKNFVVVGINHGDTAMRWKSAIEQNEFFWTQVRSTQENDLRIPFNISSFPTKILINPEGKIIYNSQNPEQKINLYDLLERLFIKNN